MKNRKQYEILSLHWGFSLGGVAKYAELLEQVSQYQNVKIKTICIYGEDWTLDSETMSSLDIETIIIKSRMDFSWRSKLRSCINQEKPDAIMTHGFNGHLVYWWSSIFLSPKILWLASYHGEYHGNSAIRRLAGRIFNYLTVLLFNNCVDRIISVAGYSKNHLVMHGVSDDKLDVIHNGIALQEVNIEAGAELRKEWGVKDDDIVFGVVSRLDPVKGIEYLIEAFSTIRMDFPAARFIVIGSGSITAQLVALVDSKGLSDVTNFVGFRSDVDNCLAALDIFVLPSLAEYHSIALLEAMRAGKAIIATDVGGNTESVRDRKEAIIVSSADAEALSKALMLLLSDEELRQNIAFNARQKFLNEFTSDIMVEKTAKWLYESINDRNTGRV